MRNNDQINHDDDTRQGRTTCYKIPKAATLNGKTSRRWGHHEIAFGKHTIRVNDTVYWLHDVTATLDVNSGNIRSKPTLGLLRPINITSQRRLFLTITNERGTLGFQTEVPAGRSGMENQLRQMVMEINTAARLAKWLARKES